MCSKNGANEVVLLLGIDKCASNHVLKKGAKELLFIAISVVFM